MFAECLNTSSTIMNECVCVCVFLFSSRATEKILGHEVPAERCENINGFEDVEQNTHRPFLFPPLRSQVLRELMS